MKIHRHRYIYVESCFFERVEDGYTIHIEPEDNIHTKEDLDRVPLAPGFRVYYQ